MYFLIHTPAGNIKLMRPLIPGISIDAGGLKAQPGAGYDQLLPPREGEESVGTEIPYLPGEETPPAE